uniref:Uncharacterized protein n=1 Tax=uncultured prokaryote TaxID=198431 RepID=A0A0H5Q759_9ZZZZ|nr:hypothetical protein [uncultured prokaryote]
MAYKPHTLVAFGGTLKDGGLNEIWQVGIRVVQPAGSGAPTEPLTDPAAYMEGISLVLGDWYGGSVLHTSEATLDWLKVNNIGADGKYSDPSSSNVYDYSPKITPTGDALYPNVLCTAYSWLTDVARGPGRTGRIYLPNNAAALATPGGMLLNAGSPGAMLTDALALLDVINNTASPDTGEPAQPVVASKVNATNSNITSVRIGNVLDMQRRRKNKLVESYTAGAWPT